MHSEPGADAERPALLALWFTLVISASVVSFLVSPAAAQDAAPPAVRAFVEPAPFAFSTSNDMPVEIHGFTRALAPRLSASYGLGLADETALSFDIARYDQTLAYGTRSDGALGDNWRHFLGLQFTPVEGLALVGGIAKAGGLFGGKGSSPSPTGYERLRLNAGLRWSWDNLGLEGWTADTSFAFIPTGATRTPSDASYMPGMGDSAATWFAGFTVSRRF